MGLTYMTEHEAASAGVGERETRSSAGQGEECPVCGQWTHTPIVNTKALRRLLGEAACRQLGIYEMPETLLVSVVVPVYNERQTIREIVRRIRAVPISQEIILVDDASTDGRREILGGFEA